MRYFKKLVGDRIYLSPRNPEDFEKFTEWFNDMEITDFVGRTSDLYTLSNEKSYLEGDDGSSLTQKIFSIITLDENKLIGSVSLENINSSNQNAILGIFIGDKDYLSKGYGTEAIRLILDYGFNYLNLHSVALDVMDFNQRAKKAYLKCGFKEMGRRREAKFINGKFYDSVQMDILRDEFHGEYIRNKNQK